MSDWLYNTGSSEIWDGTTDILTEVDYKMGMAKSTYVADRDDDVADAAGANDFIDEELSGTGYVAGWGNSGRHALSSKTITVDKANDRSYFDCADETWTGVAAGAGTPSQAITLEERATDDTNTRLHVHHDSGFPVTPNGGDITVQIATPANGGLFYLATA